MACAQLLPDFPYAIKYNRPRCPITYPNWKYDPHLQDFCHKWGQFSPHLCKKQVNPCLDVHIPMYNFNKFSKPPSFQTSKCQTTFRLQQDAFQDDSTSRCFRPNVQDTDNCTNYSSTSGGTFLNNNNNFGDDTNHCDVMEFPFEIYQCPEYVPKPVRVKSGVERCIHPSSMRYLATTNKTDLENFYKTKKRCEIELYRSKPAIDNKRKNGPRIPCDDDKGTIIRDGGPITVKAKVARWKGGNLSPHYDILIPQTLTVEKFDFCVGSLENSALPPNCKPMAVIC